MNFDPRTTLLEIKTNSEVGSKDLLRIYYYDSEGGRAGGFKLEFNSDPQYWIITCSKSWKSFPTNLPTDKNKVWRITVTKTSGIRIMVHCNEKEVLTFLVSSSYCSNHAWNTEWNRVVTKVKFDEEDTASDFFRSYPGDYI